MGHVFTDRFSEEPFWQGYLDAVEACYLALELAPENASKERLLGEIKHFRELGNRELTRTLNEFMDAEDTDPVGPPDAAGANP